MTADDIELVRGLVEIPSISRDEGEAVEWLVARMAERGFRAQVDDAGNAVCGIGEPSAWDAVTVAYKGRLALRVLLAREARHGAAPGPTCTEEALGLWEAIRAAADRRTPGADGFARLDCRLEAIQGGESDGLVERAEL